MNPQESSATQALIEKRSTKRVRVLGQYRIGGTLNFPLDLVDISEGGAGVISYGPLDVGAVVDVDLYFPDRSELTTRVRIQWAEKTEGDNSYQAGLKFVSLSDDARQKIYQFVESDAAATTH